MDGTLTSITIPFQSGSEGNGNEKVPYAHKIFKTGASLSDAV